MKIKEFRAELDRLMPEAGFLRQRQTGNAYREWRIDPENDDLVRSFGSHEIRRPWGCELLGNFIIRVPAFAIWAMKSGVMVDRPAQSIWFGAYITNYRQFMTTVAVNGTADLPALQAWISAIHDKLADLPPTLAALGLAYRHDDSSLEKFRGSDPDLWHAFGKFLDAHPTVLNTIH